MNSRQLIVSLYVILFVGFGVGAGVLFVEQARLQAQQKILERLRNDPVYVEKVLRDRWHYAKPGEVIYRFPE